MTTKTQNLGQNRGKARLWIEGSILLAEDWEQGTIFAPLWCEDRGLLIFERRAPGTTLKRPLRKVAGKPGVPIIDTNTDRLRACLGVEIGEPVTITITPQQIQIRAFNADTDTAPQEYRHHHRPA